MGLVQSHTNVIFEKNASLKCKCCLCEFRLDSYLFASYHGWKLESTLLTIFETLLFL